MKKIKKESNDSSEIKSAQSRNRTSDTRIFSPLLYQLSYLGVIDMKLRFREEQRMYRVEHSCS